jgi:NTE family protein
VAHRAFDEAPVTLRAWLAEEPFALAMSSGFFGFFAHTGMLSVLEEERLLPARVAGSSAGALVSGLWGAGLDTARIAEELTALRREHFWDPGLGFGLLKGRKFRALLEAALPAATFDACRVPIALSVYDALSRSTRVLDRGALAPAIHASCALPGLFHPVWMDGRPLIDGGVADRPGLGGLPPGTRVLHHHLAARSPWRRKEAASIQPPRRQGLVCLTLGNLPRVGPFRLAEGARAFEAARARTKLALDRPICDGLVCI